MEINFYAQTTDDINIYEFAHSAPQEAVCVGPYVRNTYLLHIVESGVCNFCGEDVGEGHAFVIAKDKLHSFSVNTGYSHWWFSFDGPCAVELLGKYTANPYEHSAVKIKDFEYAKVLLSAAFDRCRNRHDVARSAFFGILALLERSGNGEKCTDAAMAKTFIDNNYQRKISMEDTASFVCLSEKHMCALFKQIYGIPPKQYLQDIRMKKAMSLLVNTDLKIAEVALSVGYDCQLAFSGAFRKYTGVSPSEYRENKKYHTLV